MNLEDVEMTSTETSAPQSMASAEDLRKRALELQIVEMERDEKIKAREATKHSEFVEDFFPQAHWGERARHYQAPGHEGRGRRKIRSDDLQFPVHLLRRRRARHQQQPPGMAEDASGKSEGNSRSVRADGQAAGYGLKAMIINFPEGMPGDVGLFLTWEPPLE
jgi:hypothetical protein